MPAIRGYHRPTTLPAALDLLARPETAPLGGGTRLTAAAHHAEVVDLQALGLGNISREAATLTVGAMTSLRDLIDHEWTPPLLRDLARREAPNTIRNAATIGGTVAVADAESGLIAGLLALHATVSIAEASGSSEATLDAMLAAGIPGGGLITAVSFGVGGYGAFEGTARTPADIPIVLVAGHRFDDGTRRLAATGVGETPVLLADDPGAGLDPAPDFRGSAEYRLHLVRTLAARVTRRLDEVATL